MILCYGGEIHLNILEIHSDFQLQMMKWWLSGYFQENVSLSEQNIFVKKHTGHLRLLVKINLFDYMDCEIAKMSFE